MEYLHKFTTQAQCDAYMNGEDYKEPFTALFLKRVALVIMHN